MSDERLLKNAFDLQYARLSISEPVLVILSLQSLPRQYSITQSRPIGVVLAALRLRAGMPKILGLQILYLQYA